MKALPHEQRPWSINQGMLIETRKRKGYCRKCSIKLSKYNLTSYCFNHQHVGQKVKDWEDNIKMSALAKKQREINKRTYERSRNANTIANSKRARRNSKDVLSQTNYKNR